MKWEDARSGDLILVQSIPSPPDGLIFVIGNGNRYSGEIHKHVNVVFFPAEAPPEHTNLSVGKGSIEHTNLWIIGRRDG